MGQLYQGLKDVKVLECQQVFVMLEVLNPDEVQFMQYTHIGISY